VSVAIVITARVKSHRLYQKVLQEINGKTCIEHLLDHVVSQNKYPVILAIPANPDDDRLEEIAVSKGVEVYRGQDKSPFHRLLAVAESGGYDHVVRITADDILIDLNLLFQQVSFHLKGEGSRSRDYTYMKRCPEGIAGEVISTTALQKVAAEVGNKDIEFTSYYLKRGNFRVKEFFPPSPGRDYQHSFRLTMDYEEDLTLLRVIHTLLKEPGTLDIINLLKRNKYLLRINSLPAVTIYTPNYNCSEYIVDTMKSVFDQTFKDFEYIVIDDASTDDSCNKIAEYIGQLDYHNQKKIKFIRNEKNLGQAEASNRALKLARGRYIMPVDSDDRLFPDAVENLKDILEADQADCVMAGYQRTDGKDNSIGDPVHFNDKHLGCAMIKVWVMNELKYNLDLDYCIGTDFLNRMKNSNNCRITYVKHPLWWYRQREGSLTTKKEHPDNVPKN